MATLRDIWSGFIYLLKGMKVTFKTMFEEPITLQYPYEKRVLRDDYRGLFIFSEELCTGCDACARICPSECISIKTHRSPTVLKSGSKLAIDEYTINFGLCCQCHLCVEACPVVVGKGKCIYMVNEYEQSVYERAGLILTKEFMGRQWERIAPNIGLVKEEEPAEGAAFPS